MSFATTFNVFQDQRLTAGQKLVLAGIATFTDQGGKCWPAVETIAERCSMCVRTVQNHISALVKLNYLVRTYRKGRSAITQLTEKAMGWLSGTPAKSAPLPPQNLHPESVIEPIKETTAQPTAPELAESPAIAAVVVFESADTEARPAVDLVEDDPLAEVPAALLADFGIVRKAKKKAATVTKTEAVVFAAEAKKAGLTPAQAVEACIHRGWSRFEAAWLPQAPAMPVQRVYVPEVAPPASPDVIAAHRATLAALRETIIRQGKASTTWAAAALAKAASGEHIAPAAMAAARAALRL